MYPVSETCEVTMALKVYKMRSTGRARATVEVSMPRKAVEDAATSAGMTVEEFVEKYLAVAHFSSKFKGVFYTFERIPGIEDLPEAVKAIA